MGKAPAVSVVRVVSCVLLAGALAAAPSPAETLDGLRQEPLAEADYNGTPLAIGYGNLRVMLETEASRAAEVCSGGFIRFWGVLDRVPCHAIAVRVAVGGRTVATATGTVPDDPRDIRSLNLRVAIRRLDASTASPQVVMAFYSGGARCCTETWIATEVPDGSWQVVFPGEIQDDAGLAILDLDRDGTGALVDGADGFLGRFASYAAMFQPTRIRKLSGTALPDVTRDPRYRDFLLQELKRMEQAEVPDMAERNGYLAARVAQKALVGQFMDAWRAMLVSYDRQAREGRILCMMDTAHPIAGGNCPDARQHLVSFPEALARHLAELGYITPEQSAALDYDPANVGADGTAAESSGPKP
jgi:hypothetical protein